MKTNTIYQGDCLSILRGMPNGFANLIATDPPFNISLNYDVYRDEMSPEAYIAWCSDWLPECYRILRSDGSIFVCIGDEFAAEVCVTMKRTGFIMRNWIIWHYTFGQNQRKKFSRSHTHILYMVKDNENFVWNADAIKIPSARQTKYNDKRAAAGGKIPDDVWEFSRLCGTFGERIKREDGSVHPCQMPQVVMDRMILASSNPGDMVIDPFGGTGTTAAAAQSHNRHFVTMDTSHEYCCVMAKRLFDDPTMFATSETRRICA